MVACGAHVVGEPSLAALLTAAQALDDCLFDIESGSCFDQELGEALVVHWQDRLPVHAVMV